MINANPDNKTRLRETTVPTISHRSVKIVYQDNCLHCESLIKELDRLGVTYELVQVRTSAGMAYARASKSKTTPIVVLSDGDEYLSMDTLSQSQIVARILQYVC